jgi:hypothetical protein
MAQRRNWPDANSPTKDRVKIPDTPLLDITGQTNTIKLSTVLQILREQDFSKKDKRAASDVFSETERTGFKSKLQSWRGGSFIERASSLRATE